MDIKEKKKQLRQRIRERKNTLADDYCRDADLMICERLLKMPDYDHAETVFCFVGTEDEIDTQYFLEQAWKDDKCVAVPRCAEKGIMHAYEILSMADLESDKYGIREPKISCRLIHPEKIDFAVIPCISCDKRGYRLGHGGGYYDRYLENTVFTTVVVSREKLMLDAVPVGRYDKQLDWVVTENEIIKTQ